MKNVQYEQDEFIRKRMERKRRRRKRRLIAWFIFVLMLLSAVGITLCLTVFFPIKNIIVSGSELYTDKEIIKASQVSIGDNLFTVSEKKVEQRLKAALPYVEKIEFSRSLPDVLKIKVTDAEEYACCFTDGKYYILSESGWVLSSSAERPENVFEVRINGAECEEGSKAVFSDSQAYELLTEVIDELRSNNISIDYVDVTDSITIEVGVEGRFTVNFGTSNYLEQKTKHLASMIENISSEKTGKINLSMWTSENTQGTFVENYE